MEPLEENTSTITVTITESSAEAFTLTKSFVIKVEAAAEEESVNSGSEETIEVWVPPTIIVEEE